MKKLKEQYSNLYSVFTIMMLTVVPDFIEGLAMYVLSSKNTCPLLVLTHSYQQWYHTILEHTFAFH